MGEIASLNIVPGAVIAGRYEVRSRLGSGGMGVVLKVVDRELNNQMVALKLLHPHLAQDEQVFKRFLNEVLVARSLTHQNIVRIHDIAKAEGGFYCISMEFVDGESLRDRIVSWGEAHGGAPLPFLEALSLFREMLVGVQHAHEKGVVHRDLKPANVLISKEGEVKLADFGTARIMGMDTHLTQTGQTLGTPDYMSPEQIRAEPLDAASDIYSLGIVAYELATGKKPFVAENALAVAFKHLSEPVGAMSETGVKVPVWYEKLVQCATAKQRGDRFSSVQEILDLIAANAPEVMHRRRSVGAGGAARGAIVAEDPTQLEQAAGGNRLKELRFDTEREGRGERRRAEELKFDLQREGRGETTTNTVEAKKRSVVGWLSTVIFTVLAVGAIGGFWELRRGEGGLIRIEPAEPAGTRTVKLATEPSERAEAVTSSTVTFSTTTMPPRHSEPATVSPPVEIPRSPAPTPVEEPKERVQEKLEEKKVASVTPKPADKKITEEQPLPPAPKVEGVLVFREGVEQDRISLAALDAVVWEAEVRGIARDAIVKMGGGALEGLFRLNIVSIQSGKLLAKLTPRAVEFAQEGGRIRGGLAGAPLAKAGAGRYRADLVFAGEVLSSKEFSAYRPAVVEEREPKTSPPPPEQDNRQETLPSGKEPPSVSGGEVEAGAMRERFQQRVTAPSEGPKESGGDLPPPAGGVVAPPPLEPSLPTNPVQPSLPGEGGEERAIEVRRYQGSMELTESEEKSVLTLEVTAQGPILRGTATIQGVGEFQVEGRVLTRGVELVLRGEPFSLRLTGVQREKTLRGTYNIPSQKRSGPFQLQER